VVAPFNLVEGRNLLLLLAEPREFTRLFAEIHDDLLGVLLDLGHLRVTAKTLGFDKADFIEAVAPTIGGFHLHDNDGDSDQHLPVQAGSWALSVLVQERFNGRPVVVEAKFEGAAELAKHCLWLENLLNR
jgi:sugar phosphate isomerase/epimerase